MGKLRVNNWIPVSKHLSRKRKVIAIALATKRSRREVAGTLVDFWSWVDDETADGLIPDATLDSLLSVFENTDIEFWRNVVKVGWLEEQAAGLFIPNFERWLGNSAKARLQANTRQALSRENRDKSVTRGDERILDFGEESPSPSCPEPQAATGPIEPQPAMGMDALNQSAQDRKAPADRAAGTAASPVVCSPASDRPPVLIFPTVGRGPHRWPLTEDLLNELQSLFPAVDVRGECRHALAWVLAVPSRRKTARGMRRFLTDWLARANDGRPSRYGNDYSHAGRAGRVESPPGKYDGIGREVGAMPAATEERSGAVLAPAQGPGLEPDRS